MAKIAGFVSGRTCAPAALALAATAIVASPAHAQKSVADFYAGKTITISVGTTAGGGYDVDSRLLARHLGRFIPGKPALVVQNVAGARGLTAVNRLYATNPRDGTFMGVVQRGLISAPWLNPLAVQYDAAKFNWLFSLASEPGVAIVWKPKSQLTVDDLRKTEIVIGGAGDSTIIPQVFNYTIGTKFKIIGGYPGTQEVALAMQRGEVQGFGYYSWSNIPSKNPDWLSEKKIAILMQTGFRRLPELPNVPLARELALDANKQRIQDLWLAPLDTARAYAMPPEVPLERVAAVREAFMTMVKDAAFLEDAQKAGMAVDPRSSDDIIAMINRFAATPKDIIEEARGAAQE